MSVNENIVDFMTSDGNGDGTYTVTRRAAGSFSSGRFTPGSASTFPITAVVQPLSGGKDLQVLPEGMHVEDVRKIFTDTELKATAGSPDTLVIGGETYAVFSAAGPWELDGAVHWECLAARQTIP